MASILDFLKSYLPEDTTGMPEQDYTSDISRSDYIQPQPGPMPIVPQVQPVKGLDYGNTFLRTPANEVDAKAAETMRQLFFPPEQAKLENKTLGGQPIRATPMSPAQEKILETTSTSTTTKKPVEAKKEAPKKEEPAKDLPETSFTRKALEIPKEEEDKELTAALEQRRKDLAMADIMKAGARIGTALSTHGTRTLEQLSPGAFEGFRQQAMLPVEDIKTKRSAAAEKLKGQMDRLKMAQEQSELSTSQEKTDPNSQISKFYVESVKKAFPGVNAQGMTAAELEKIFPVLQNAANMKEAIEARKENARMYAAEREERKTERQERKDEKTEQFREREEAKYQTALSKIDAKNREATKYMDEAVAMAEQATSNPQSALNLARGVIKAIEGAGARVSDKDFSTAVGNQALGAKVMDTFTKLNKGTIRGVTKNDVIAMLDASRKIQARKYEEAVKAEVERYGKRAKITPEEAADVGVVSKDILVPPEQRFPRQVRNMKTGQSAMVSNEQELKEANAEGFE